MSIKDAIISDPKIGGAVAATTTGSGLAGLLDWLPLSEVATIVGIILSCVLIYTHLRKGRIEYEKTRLEIKILEQKAGMSLEDAATEGDDQQTCGSNP